MSGFAAVCGAALFLAIATVLLRTFGSRSAGAIAAVGGILLIKSVLSGTAESILTLETRFGLSLGEAGSAALRLFGIGMLGSLSSDLCRDLGEGAIARGITVVTKAEMLLLVFPKILSVLEAGLALWEGV